MTFWKRFFGRPLSRYAAADQRLPNFQALPILASDALSSVAYATEAALGVLVLGGSAALGLSVPITVAIIALIAIVVLSYRQAISAYPDGGGSYVVVRENLGRNIGLIAAAALLTLVGSNYAFKALCALIDTVPLYLLVHWLRGYLELEPGEYATPQPDEAIPTP